MTRSFFACAALLFGSTLLSAAQGPAATPPMGWNSWNWFAGKVTDKDIRQAADLIVSSGMRDAGYVYVNIDDTWEGKRDANGVLHTNEKFPDMKALADYVHSKGLKLGIYSSPGPLTCAKYEGSMGHEEQDAKLYAEWGIDFLKYDLCSYGKIMRDKYPNDADARDKMMRDAYETMHQALLKAGRPMVYSLCQYGFGEVWKWGPSVGASMWRTTGDIKENYDRMMMVAFETEGLAKYAGPGHWNDPDMLEVGNGKLTRDENLTHMSLWAIMAAPLLAGNNLTQMDDGVRQILTNREIIAINQDKAGVQGRRVWSRDQLEIWTRPLADGSTALAVFNVGEDRNQITGATLHYREVGVGKGSKARDVWAAKDLGAIEDGNVFTLPRHGVLLLKIAK